VVVAGLHWNTGRAVGGADGEVDMTPAELAALVGRIDEALTPTCCRRCSGEGRLWADGKAHYHSDTRPTVACGACGGAGEIPGGDLVLARAALRTLVGEWPTTERRDISGIRVVYDDMRRALLAALEPSSGRGSHDTEEEGQRGDTTVLPVEGGQGWSLEQRVRQGVDANVHPEGERNALLPVLWQAAKAEELP